MVQGSYYKRLERQDGRIFTFLFTPLNTPEGKKYYIIVIDDNHLRHSFYMSLQNDVWRLAKPNQCPTWIVEMEKQLEIAILDGV